MQHKDAAIDTIRAGTKVGPPEEAEKQPEVASGCELRLNFLNFSSSETNHANCTDSVRKPMTRAPPLLDDSEQSMTNPHIHRPWKIGRAHV